MRDLSVKINQTDNQSMEEVDPCWVYFKVILGQYFHVYDYLICNVLPTVIEKVAHKKWFFLRMLDEDGLQLRIRFLAENMNIRTTMANEISKLFQEAIYEFSIIPESTYTPLVEMSHSVLLEEIKMPLPRLIEAVYEPEFDKYGTGKLLEQIETHFNISSEIALSIINAEMYQERSRKWLACLLMAEVAHYIDRHRPWSEFLTDYTEFWLYSMPNGIEYLPTFDKNIQRIEEQNHNPLELSNLTAEELCLLRRWRDSLARVMSSTEKSLLESRNFRDNLMFNLSHLLFNRLGFSTIDEAYIAYVTAYFYGRKNELLEV